MIHRVKIEDVYMEQILSGEKKFEVRYNDRGYQRGDVLQFLTIGGIERDVPKYEIIYVHSGLGMKDPFVILGIEKTK